MMNYEDTLSFLYSQLPMFQRVGGSAYKAGLDTSLNLARLYDNPHNYFRTIHVAGTNGKGSTSHTLAALLQINGYKVGLYTSPHLIDFRERIRINGEMIPKDKVVKFVEKYERIKDAEYNPSFFELTMMMAFDYFRNEKVDIAIIEVGMGGRLDSTNIITPSMCIITNISYDHTQFLGDTLPKIAFEKAGIIKSDIPVIIGEASNNEVREVFEKRAFDIGAPIYFSEDTPEVLIHERSNGTLNVTTKNYGKILPQLSGECQIKNINTILCAVSHLNEIGIYIKPDTIAEAFNSVCSRTGLMGRWMKVGDSPLVICDTGHNIGGFQYITHQLREEKYDTLHIVIGFVNDKDISHILDMMPKDAIYYFAQASIPRALNSDDLTELAHTKGLNGNSYHSVKEAYKAAIINSIPSDMIYVGGSTFVVADFLEFTSMQ